MGASALDDEPPTVTLAAEQPLPPDLVVLLGSLAGRPADQPVWPGRCTEKAAETIGVDLEAAGIPSAVEGRDCFLPEEAGGGTPGGPAPSEGQSAATNAPRW